MSLGDNCLISRHCHLVSFDKWNNVRRGSVSNTSSSFLFMPSEKCEKITVGKTIDRKYWDSGRIKGQSYQPGATNTSNMSTHTYWTWSLMECHDTWDVQNVDVDLRFPHFGHQHWSHHLPPPVALKTFIIRFVLREPCPSLTRNKRKGWGR